MTTDLSGFVSEVGRADYLAAYDRVLVDLWPVSTESILIESRFGTTHAIASGPVDAPPLMLLHAAGLSATQWYPNIADFAHDFRVYAPDSIFDSGGGRQTREMHGREDCARWLGDVLDGLGIDQAPFVGLSQGAWLAASAARFIPDRVTRAAVLAPAATLRPMRLPVLLLLRLRPFLPKKEPLAETRKTFRTVFGGRYMPDERYVAQVALGAQHFRYQKPPIFPTVFPDQDLRRIAAPTLLLVAAHEVMYNPGRALERARLLVPDLEAEVVPDAGHFVSMEQAEIVDRRVLEFLGVDRHGREPEEPSPGHIQRTS
ncbi:MAG TPA: alpha/beta hydrolase [Candidatus Deferrimicrobiaceae bacterium]|nr:alpha/beta hydrolase [Candidatus Deferrimicrobiaceae bacterium]